MHQRRSVEVAVFRVAVPSQEGYVTTMAFSTCDNRTSFGTHLSVFQDECPDPWAASDPVRCM